LANDPHLPNAIPAVMYLAQLRSPGLAVAGASWVGVPAFAPGHNGHVAWGATAAHADNTDLFLEQVSSDGLSVREGDGWVRCPVREERIEVRGEASVLERVLQTPRGPIISPALSDTTLPEGANALSLAATWLAKRPYEGLYSAPRARSFDEFRQHFAAGSASTISYVYADTSGTIGWHLAVEVPRRRRPGALIPRVGWDPDAGWHDEPHRCTDLPFARDPDEGFLCTANNQPIAAANGVVDDLGVDWLDGYRQASIAAALAKRDDWSVQDCADLQRDTLSLPWREMESTVLGLSLRDARAERAQSLLAQWDGRVSSDSVAAAVYVVFISELTCALVRRLAPRSSSWALGKGFTAMLPHSTIANRRLSHLVAMVKRQPSEIFADWPAALEAALARAIAKLEDRFGRDESAWRWGRVRPLTLVHAFADKPPFDRVFNLGPLDGEGDPSTISQGGLDLADPFSGQLWLPTLRAVLDVGDWERCRFALAGGQSGNPTSPHYADQIDVWRTGEGIPIAWSEETIARRCRHELMLVPR
jgi:penicillin amidase